MSLIQHASISTNTEGYGIEHEKNAKKRTRDEAEQLELDKRPFSIRPDSQDPFAPPQALTPLCLLSRVQLPLAFLDTATTGNRLFSAHLGILETLGSENDANVLVAEDEKRKRLYAIEQAGWRTYALCRLANWVERHSLEEKAKVVLEHDEQQVKRRALQPVENGQQWWTRAAVQIPQQPDASSTAGVMPQLRMIPDPAVSSNAEVGLPERVPNEAASEPQCAEGLPNEEPEPPSTPSTPRMPDEVLQELTKHYLEALYLSRTSLAYFTKGPLSRARAAFTSDSEAGFEAAGLIAALRDAILTASMMDQKFKDTVTGAIKELSPRGLETPEKSTNKRKRKWKAKRDRRGFWADERECLEKWWLDRDDAGGAPSSVETVDAALKRLIPRLRSRETYLQVILALEVLALEKAHPPQAGEVGAPKAYIGQSQQQDTQVAEKQAPKVVKKPKPKKLQDLPALLDALLDRLCIWHSLGSHSPSMKGGEGCETSQDTPDELKSFCVEVIIPFYMSRIPQHAASVNKKLGGPSVLTPVKRKLSSSRKPGEPAIRPAPENIPRRPLSRPASEAKRNVSKLPPGLRRAATDLDVLRQQIKREGSQTPDFDSIPQAKLPQPRKRTSLMHSVSLNRREVDLSAMSQANEAKMRRKADVNTKLRQAMDALKKPNRALALKEAAENVDMSFAKAMVRSRITAKGQPSVKDAVHVTATPKHPRTVRATLGRGLGTSRRAAGSSSGATSLVPSSSARLLAQPHDHMEPSASSFAVPQTGHRPRHTAGTTGIEGTPSRGFAKFMPAGLTQQPGTLESPIAARTVSPAHIEQTTVEPIRNLSLVPLAPAPTEPLIEASPNAMRRASPRKHHTSQVDRSRPSEHATRSIYDALGWDEECCEDLG